MWNCLHIFVFYGERVKHYCFWRITCSKVCKMLSLVNQREEKVKGSKWELNKVYQDRWVARFLLVKTHWCSRREDAHGYLQDLFHCGGEGKTISARIGLFDKHSRMWKCLVRRPRVDVKEHFFCPTNAHVKSMHNYFVHNLKWALEAWLWCLAILFLKILSFVTNKFVITCG